MPDVLLELTVASSPEAVFQAISQKSGLERWWTPDVPAAEACVGSIAELRFRGGAFVIKFEVTELQPPHSLRWALHQGAPEWSGTSVEWELSRTNDGQTCIRFAHRGYPSTEGSYASVTFNWAFYLSSLRDYLQTGRGRPDVS